MNTKRVSPALLLRSKMMLKLIRLTLATAICIPLYAQPDFVGVINGPARPVFALPDFRGSGDAQKLMDVFNQTLLMDLQGSGLFKIVPKTMYPLFIPQQPGDFQQPPSPATEPKPPRKGKAAAHVEPAPDNGGGRWISDWSGPPVSANYLAFGYTGIVNGVLVLRGFLFDLGRTLQGAQMLAESYNASQDEAGARRVAHEYARDILKLWNAKSLFDTHIYFVSNRSGQKEIWVMDPDGANQRQVTALHYLATDPAVSPDGSKLAFTGWPGEGKEPRIYVYSTNPVRNLGFQNRDVSVSETPSFGMDGKQIAYASAIGGTYGIFIAKADGSGARSLTAAPTINVEPKINPKTGTQIVFVSDRSGPPQIYSMNTDGEDVERLTSGLGEATNPSWNPNGQTIAFAWTQGYAPGSFNIFVMDVVARKPIQLTHNEGKNENPSWGPDAAHIVFGSNRSGSFQIWTMLADGTQLRQLTTAGSNTNPVWGQ